VLSGRKGDERIRDNRRIVSDGSASPLDISHGKTRGYKWLKAQMKCFHSHGMRELDSWMTSIENPGGNIEY
jgi:hypothetical protein